MSAVLLVAASTNPSPYWYATRGLGVSTLIVLTATVVLGILSATRWSGESTPGFVAVDLHRNFSLLATFLLLAHIVTTVLDPFAHISIRDVLIPIGAQYRPIWLGLGVVAFWILVALIGTSLFRERVGLRLWRVLHWAAYAAWPIALVHGLGTGSDARAPWMVSVVASCCAAVLLAVADRLRDGRMITLPIRGASGVAMIGFFGAAAVWAANGPFQADWAARAGTPVTKVASTARLGPVHPGPEGFSDPLVGVLVRDKSGAIAISLRDSVDPTLTLAVRSPNGTSETLPVVTVSRGTRVLCTVPANTGTTLYAVCGKVRMVITLYASDTVLQTGGQVTGRLDTTGPLN